MIKHAGELDRRVTIVIESLADDDFGQLTPVSTTTRDVWAKKVEHIGNEGDNGDEVSSPSVWISFCDMMRSHCNRMRETTFCTTTKPISSNRFNSPMKGNHSNWCVVNIVMRSTNFNR